MENISISLNKTRYFVELLHQIIPHVVTFFALVAFDVARDCEDAVRSKVGEFVDYGSTGCGPWIRWFDWRVVWSTSLSSLIGLWSLRGVMWDYDMLG